MIFIASVKPDHGNGDPVSLAGRPGCSVGENDYSVLSSTGSARGRSRGRLRCLPLLSEKRRI
ncbi:unnamed protein product [Prunus armeniaca]